MIELKVGQKVFVKKVNNRARQYKDNLDKLVEEEEISKVGNKYFYLKDFDRYKFCREQFRDISIYCSNYVVYLSKQEIEEENEFNQKLDYIRKIFREFGTPDIELNKIRDIYNILKK